MFWNKMNETFEEDNFSITENGALGYRSTNTPLLDLNFSVSSLRNSSEEEICEKYMKAFWADPKLATLWLFYARDIRGGLGERRLFRVVIEQLACKRPDLVRSMIPLIPEYGRFDDLWVLLDSSIGDQVIAYIKTTLQADMIGMQSGESITLLAKWLPSINTSSKESVLHAKKLAKTLNMSEATYRKTLSSLRKYLDVVERKMSAREWSEIQYETVPSRANLLYKNAFLEHDTERRTKFLEKVESGEAKINANVLFPHDIVHRYFSEGKMTFRGSSSNAEDSTLESLWRAMPRFSGILSDTLVVSDGSGSMTVRVGNTQISALEVAISLAIYFSEQNQGEFKDRYITFSQNPKFVDFSKATTLHEKLQIALKHSEVANTNIEAVFRLILSTARKNKMKQSDIPKTILILSDMEFDMASSNKVNQALFNQITSEYRQYGYDLPRLVFWNLNSRTHTIPLCQNKLGIALVSGFSPVIANLVLSNELDPMKGLVNELLKDRYTPVAQIFDQVEGL